jgi:hypothetical protein
VIGFGHGRVARVLSLILAAVWMVTLVSAETSITPPMRCQRSHMPCCPSSDSCSRAQCTEQVSEQAETQTIGDQEREASCSATGALPVPVLRQPTAALHELTLGLRFHFPVFGLKDDLRI